MRRWKADISNVGEKCALYGLEGSWRMGHEGSPRRMLQRRKAIRSGLQAAGSIGIVTGNGIKGPQRQICVPRWKDIGRTFGQYLVLDIQIKASRDIIILLLLRRLPRFHPLPPPPPPPPPLRLASFSYSFQKTAAASASSLLFPR